ncbi:universal stress protein [Lentzea sp. NBC_00516]|uniref:Universal stress protein n=1 Tax=Lentzea sokolovensis TaxID=3095429 RepID=A0ABU4UPJ3_9PSEU|nr:MULTISPECIES: universal stress protein [unclassified Lentzea]MDX8141416.1 universal stress protein [Lentzea sp. BCCO 10_0061]WUD27239.1 universal stress protein [Lentzea sp. NBC_00516]
MSENESRPIAVGVDGSPAARAALRWAVGEAQRRGCRVDAIAVWRSDSGIVIGALTAEVGMQLTREAIQAGHDAMLEEAVNGLEGAEIRRVLVEGDPRTVLTEASQEADLLVVGNRGHGLIAEAILGSVSAYCVRHASCPVVVIREAKAEPEPSSIKPVVPLTPGPLL